MNRIKSVLKLLLGVLLIVVIVKGKIYATTISESLNNYNLDNNSLATGTYANWKNNAITYPMKGQLVAAGYSKVKFCRLEEAVKYEIYVDDELIKTIEGGEAKASSYEIQFKSVKVEQHTTYVVATLANGKKVTSNIRNFYISKKGMGIWQADSQKIEELNLSWYYNWSPYELEGVSETVEFVPMIWGDEADERSVDRQNEWKWLRNGGWKEYRYLLTFNEPDFSDQSNITPERAVELWKDIEPICDDENIDVSSPVVAIPTVFYTDTNNDHGTVGGWYGKYNQLMATAQYHDEFTTVHFYFDYPGEYILDILDQIHEKTGKPIWITEWGVGQWSQVQNFDWTGGPDEGNWQREIIVNFMNEIIPKLDQLDYIERYAWFPFDGSNTEKFGNGAGGLFYCGADDPLKGQLTAVGEAYKKVGNPAGWDSNKVTEDIVVIDEENDDEKGSENEENSNKNDNIVESDLEKTKTGDLFNAGKLRYKVTKVTKNVSEIQVAKSLKKTNSTVTIPSTVLYKGKTYKVTAVAKNAFKNNTRLKKVTIGKNVETIGANAFYGCKKLSTVVIGKNVKTIGSKAFYNCGKLAKVTFKGNKVKKIGSKAFVNTNKKIKFKVGNKKNIGKYKKILKKKVPRTARFIK